MSHNNNTNKICKSRFFTSLLIYYFGSKTSNHAVTQLIDTPHLIWSATLLNEQLSYNTL